MDDPSADPARIEADEQALAHEEVLADEPLAHDEALADEGALRSPDSETFGAERARERACPWCMEPLPEGEPDRCPSCGARLREVEPGAEIPGVTALTPEVARIAQVVAARQAVRSDELPGVLRLGEQEEHAALEPPSSDVIREMRRLELEAEGGAVETPDADDPDADDPDAETPSADDPDAETPSADEAPGPDMAPGSDEEPS